jgi:hypothetical protein
MKVTVKRAVATDSERNGPFADDLNLDVKSKFMDRTPEINSKGSSGLHTEAAITESSRISKIF